MKDQALYLEADEDITSAIDKLAKTTGSSVQIVVPKRSTLLQSIINLKLLKKAAADNGKELVLVTGDKVATDLAARLGLAVAPSLGAKATIADAAPAPEAANEDIIEADDPDPMPLDEEPPPPKPPTKAAAAAAAGAAFFKRKPVADKPPVSPPPVSPPPAADATPPAPPPPPADEAAAKPAGPKKSQVPNFGRLQKRIVWAGLAVFLVVGYFVYVHLAASASVALFAAGTKVAVDTTFSVDPNQTTSNLQSGVLAGQTVTYSKDISGPFTPTGTQDQGTKATGQMTVSNGTGVDQPLVAGTRFAAPDGKVFRSGSDITVPKAYLNNNGDKVNGTASVAVTADQNGDTYNQEPAAYTIPALNNAKITAQGGKMSGGTTKTVTVVSADDVAKAQTDLLASGKDDAQKALDAKVPAGYMAMPSSTTTTVGTATPSPAVGAAGSSATLNLHVTFTQLAVKKADFTALIKAREQAQVGKTNQIYDDGISTAQITSTGKDPSGKMQFNFSGQAYSGARIDTSALATSMAGKKYGDAVDIASKQPGVQHVTVAIKPSWLTSMPSNPDKIKITIQVASDK